MFCMKCGNKVADDAAFCSRCGAPLKAEAQKTKNGALKGAQNGVAGGEENPPEALQQQKPPMKKPVLLAIVATAVVLAAVIGGGRLLRGDRKVNTGTGASSSTVESSKPAAESPEPAETENEGTVQEGTEAVAGGENGDTESGGVQDGWVTIDGMDYWYESGVRQGYAPDDPAYRGKEIYDPGTDAWYWLDNTQQGAKAVSRDVYLESQADDAGNMGKWVRYDEEGHRVQGWQEQNGNQYYFDPIYGTMAKGDVEIDGKTYCFDQDTGICQGEKGITKEEALELYRQFMLGDLRAEYEGSQVTYGELYEIFCDEVLFSGNGCDMPAGQFALTDYNMDNVPELEIKPRGESVDDWQLYVVEPVDEGLKITNGIGRGYMDIITIYSSGITEIYHGMSAEAAVTWFDNLWGEPFAVFEYYYDEFMGDTVELAMEEAYGRWLSEGYQHIHISHGNEFDYSRDYRGEENYSISDFVKEYCGEVVDFYEIDEISVQQNLIWD